MKRGITKQVSIQRTVTYWFTYDDLIKRLRLPAGAAISFDGIDLRDAATDDGVDGLRVDIQENVQARPAAPESEAA